MEFLILAVLLVCLLACFAAFRASARRKKLERNLKERFGKIPKPAYGSFFDSIPCYWEERRAAEKPEHVIDDITWDDLDMDDVFRRLNACQTSVGEEYLYALLHQPSFFREELKRREGDIAFFQENPERRLAVQKLLASFGKLRYNGVAAFLYHTESKQLGNPVLYQILGWLPAVFLIASFILPRTFLPLFVCLCILNGFVYYFSKRKVEGDLAAVRYMGSMLWCCGKLLKQEKGAPFLHGMEEPFRVFRPFAAKISGMMQQSISQADFLTDYLKIIFLYDLKNYNRLTKVLSENREVFHSLFQALGEVDACISIASFRASLPHWCVPEFGEENTLKCEEIYHPLLRAPVCNSAYIRKNSLVTGSNASGKSTFIKALAVNSILAQTIHTCTAKRYETRFVLTVTSMAVRDNVTEGDSYFIAEIKSLKRVLKKAGELHCLCFVDEILKGTNTVERIAASSAVLYYLKGLDTLCITATHDMELAEILGDAFDNYHFREQVTDEGITFDYLLKQGPSTSRNAIRLLGFMEFDKEIVSRAEQMAEAFEKEKRWRTL